METASEPVRAARLMLAEVCQLLAAEGAEAVLVGGWVPGVRFPHARPAHLGSLDVDLALRLDRQRHEAVVALLRQRGFRVGPNSYQFFKDVILANGRTVPVRLDLLTGERHHAEFFGAQGLGPEPVPGADLAFQDNGLMPMGEGGPEVRVAGLVAFVVMKSLAMARRQPPKGKDAYDLHFCLKHHPDGLAAIAREFGPWLGDDLVREGMDCLARWFRDPESEGPCAVADLEEAMGEARAMVKQEACVRVREFLTLVGWAG